MSLLLCAAIFLTPTSIHAREYEGTHPKLGVTKGDPGVAIDVPVQPSDVDDKNLSTNFLPLKVYFKVSGWQITDTGLFEKDGNELNYKDDEEDGHALWIQEESEIYVLRVDRQYIVRIYLHRKEGISVDEMLKLFKDDPDKVLKIESLVPK